MKNEFFYFDSNSTINGEFWGRDGDVLVNPAIFDENGKLIIPTCPFDIVYESFIMKE